MPGDQAEGERLDGPPPLAVTRVPGGHLTPRQIVEALDRHVIGQGPAKRAVAIAMRNRLRRQAVGGELGHDITPRNILMIGPTGVGKTEIARRLARLTGSPFLKVEASKFTEVGYVGRDVESMVRDLTLEAIHVVRSEHEDAVRAQAEGKVEERLVDLLLPTPSGPAAEGEPLRRRRDAVRTQLRAGHLDGHRVEIEVTEAPKAPGLSIFSGQGMENIDVNISGMLPGMFRQAPKRKTVTVGEARQILLGEEQRRLVDDEVVQRLAIERVQTSGIIFLDEIDKVAGREGAQGPDVSREGVQRDLLPIVEGTTVQTKWGPVRTDHVLFIAAGAFHVSKPSDLIPELQGRFPVRVELTSLTKEDLIRILQEPDSSLARQSIALLATEGIALRFTADAIEAIAEFATRVNESTEDIGARRLYTILETVLEDVSFDAGEIPDQEVVIDGDLVRAKLTDIVKDQDYARYVL